MLFSCHYFAYATSECSQFYRLSIETTPVSNRDTKINPKEWIDPQFDVNQERWSSGNFTDPAIHRDSQFRYVVHGVFDGKPTAQSVLKNPDVLKERLLSTSLIDQDHRATFGWYGFILKAPHQNIVATSPRDMGIPNLGNFGFLKNSKISEVISKWSQMFGIASPEKILEETPTSVLCNEIAVLGSTSFGQVEIAAIFIKVNSKGNAAIDPYKGSILGKKIISDEVLQDIRAVALQRNIPIVEIRDSQYDYGIPDYIRAKVWQFQKAVYRWQSR